MPCAAHRDYIDPPAPHKLTPHARHLFKDGLGVEQRGLSAAFRVRLFIDLAALPSLPDSALYCAVTPDM